MSKLLEGKVVVVTGAGGGLGGDFALALGGAGAFVVVNDVGAALDGTGHDESAAGQSRPLRSVHRSEGWTAETIATHAMPALAAQLYGLERSPDVFSWDPV